MFESLRRDIKEFTSTAIKDLESETEEWYKDNIRLGGTQKAKGVVGEMYDRKHNYPHPALQETKQLVNSIKAKNKHNRMMISHAVINYRGRQDYGKIQNERYGFMKKSKPLMKHLNNMFSSKLKNIFK